MTQNFLQYWTLTCVDAIPFKATHSSLPVCGTGSRGSKCMFVSDFKVSYHQHVLQWSSKDDLLMYLEVWRLDRPLQPSLTPSELTCITRTNQLTQYWSAAIAIYPTLSRQLCKTLLTRRSLCLYINKSFDASTVMTLHKQLISNGGVPVAPLRLLPSVSHSNPWRGKKYDTNMKNVGPFCEALPFLWFSIFLISNIEHLPMVRHTPRSPSWQYKIYSCFGVYWLIW